MSDERDLEAMSTEEIVAELSEMGGFAAVPVNPAAFDPKSPLGMALSRRTWGIDCQPTTIGRGKSARVSWPRIIEGPRFEESDEEAEQRMIESAEGLAAIRVIRFPQPFTTEEPQVVWGEPLDEE